MSIRQAITDISSFLDAAPPQWRTPQLAMVSVDLSRRAAMVRSALPEIDLPTLEKKFHQAIETNDWTSIDPMDWSAVTHYLWKSQLNLLSIHRFHFNYRRYLESNKTARTWKRLIYSYLEAYDPKLEGIEWAGSLIRKILMQRRFLILEYWREIEFKFQVFSTFPGPIVFATSCLEHPESAIIPQQEVGLVGHLATAGYARNSYLAAYRLVAVNDWRSSIELRRLERYLQWTQNDPTQSFLRFPEFQEQLLQLLLTRVPSSREACELIGKFFTAYAEAWHKNDPSCIEPSPEQIKIVGKILTEATKG